MISEAAKMKDMMQIEAGQKLIELGSGKHEETEKRLGDIAVERTRIQEKLMKCSGSKKLKSTNKYFEMYICSIHAQLLMLSGCK